MKESSYSKLTSHVSQFNFKVWTNLQNQRYMFLTVNHNSPGNIYYLSSNDYFHLFWPDMTPRFPVTNWIHFMHEKIQRHQTDCKWNYVFSFSNRMQETLHTVFDLANVAYEKITNRNLKHLATPDGGKLVFVFDFALKSAELAFFSPVVERRH